MTDRFEHPAPQPGDRELAVYLHDNACQDDSCGGWEMVSSFGKAGWLDLARAIIAMVSRNLTAADDLGAAWAEAEKALPEGCRDLSVEMHFNGCFAHMLPDATGLPDDPIGVGPTPAAALRALAARLEANHD